jgi:multidrug efflux pump subunit AcrA (membrane-fusion protein)
LHVTSPDVPGEQYLARVKEVSPVIDPSSGTFEALVEFVGNRGELRPGMTANVRLETPR